MARIWLGLIAALVFAAAAHAQSGVSAEIIDFGIYNHEIERKVEAPGTPAGLSAQVRDPKLIESTTCIPAKVGVNFGIRYRIVADHANMFVSVRKVVRYPAPGLRNPRSDKVYDENEKLESMITGSGAGYWGYGFDEQWEAMPGTWVFEIWHNNTLLASQKFEVMGSCFRGS